MSQPNLTDMRVDSELSEETSLLTQSHPPVTPTYRSITFFPSDGFPIPETAFARNYKIGMISDVSSLILN